MTTRARSGMLLILVAGISALIASLALALFLRMRSDAAQSATYLNYVQARVMLMAACNYILEAGRVGWETDTYDANGRLTTPGGARHEETYGWVDVRDGFMGPKTELFLASDWAAGGRLRSRPEAQAERARLGRSLTLQELQAVVESPNFPIGTVGRFPMYVRERPPFALSASTTPNPILTPFTPTPVAMSDPAFGQPYLRNPDPRPAVMDDTPAAAFPIDERSFVLGRPIPRPESANLGWFRVFRDGPATFVVTCGAGGTQGFRDWDEVEATGNEALFGNDRRTFEELVAAEVRLWYRLEWSPAVQSAPTEISVGSSGEGYGPLGDFLREKRGGNDLYDVGGAMVPAMQINICGTIQWVQRLAQPPLMW